MSLPPYCCHRYKNKGLLRGKSRREVCAVCTVAALVIVVEIRGHALVSAAAPVL